MYGAIIGDIIGSRFEFDRGGKTKDFELFTREDKFTDDTVMTIAVGEALMNAGTGASDKEIRESVIRSMRDWGHRYPGAGYGGRFSDWLFFEETPKPYASFGNGSAMRVSAAGWLYDSLEKTRAVARLTAEVTHNHPEGIKGAECTAAVMYLGRTGSTKDKILKYVTDEFGYDLSETLEEMRARHKHVETCQDSLPKALRSFFDGNSYEDVIRNAVSLGGDTDTLAAIAGAMAEAFYGMPLTILAEGKTYLPEDMQTVLDRFDKILGRENASEEEETYKDNKYIKAAVDLLREKQNLEAYTFLLNVLLQRLLDEGEAPAPMVDKNHVMDTFDPTGLKAGDTFRLDQDLHLTIDKIRDNDGNIWIPLYTDTDEVNKGNTTNFQMNLAILTILREACCYEKSSGLVINPFSQALTIPKENLSVLLEKYVEPGKQ